MESNLSHCCCNYLLYFILGNDYLYLPSFNRYLSMLICIEMGEEWYETVGKLQCGKLLGKYVAMEIHHESVISSGKLIPVLLSLWKNWHWKRCLECSRYFFINVAWNWRNWVLSLKIYHREYEIGYSQMLSDSPHSG